MTNEELLKSIEAQAFVSGRIYSSSDFEDGYQSGYIAAVDAAADILRENAPALRPASEATVGEDVMIVVANHFSPGNLIVHTWVTVGTSGLRFVEQGRRMTLIYEEGDVIGWFPVPEFAKVNP